MLLPCWGTGRFISGMSVFEARLFDKYLVSSKVRMSDTPKFQLPSSPSLILKGFLILGSGCKDDALYLYNVQVSISSSWQISGQCKQSGSLMKGHAKSWKICVSLLK